MSPTSVFFPFGDQKNWSRLALVLTDSDLLVTFALNMFKGLEKGPIEMIPFIINLGFSNLFHFGSKYARSCQFRRVP